MDDREARVDEGRYEGQRNDGEFIADDAEETCFCSRGGSNVLLLEGTRKLVIARHLRSRTCCRSVKTGQGEIAPPPSEEEDTKSSECTLRSQPHDLQGFEEVPPPSTYPTQRLGWR